MKRSLLITLLLALLLAVTGCVAPTTGGATDGAAAGGGQAVLIIPEEPATLNPYLAVAAIVEQVSDATVVGLSYVDADGEFQPELAQEIPVWGELHKEMLTHMSAHGVDPAKDGVLLSSMLEFDVETGRFTGPGAERANPFLKRQYRAPYIVPEDV